MFIIKICGITNEEDARVAIEGGANALGFNFYPGSSRYIAPARAREIIESLSGEVLKVGVFVNSTGGVPAQVPLDVLQLHGTCASNRNHRIWRALRAGDYPDDPLAEAYLMDTPGPGFGGSGKTFDWGLAARSSHRVVIAGGLDATNVAEAIRIAQPWGVDACSRLESSPGKKDPLRVRSFIKAALNAVQIVQEVTQ